MKSLRLTRLSAAVATLLASMGVLPGSAQAQVVINDKLNGASSSYDWRALQGACLTAGNNTGSIPACVGLPYYGGGAQKGGQTGTMPDVVGQGALRLTAPSTYQIGAVVSNFTFPSTQGLQVTFTSVTYGGSGADGISFYLVDGSKPPTVGGSGGALGYSCSNGNPTYEGVAGAYLGIGIDEFGNFSNPGDNTDSGPGFQAGRITVRGAGDTNFAGLNAAYPALYPLDPTQWKASVNKEIMVKSACSSGYLTNFSQVAVTDPTSPGATIASGSQSAKKMPYNYRVIGTPSDLPAGSQIDNQRNATTPRRDQAQPITYAIKLTQDGKLDFSYSINGGSTQQVLSSFPITTSNGPLPASFRFGFSAGTGGSTNIHEITCFKAAGADESQGSAGTNVQQSSRVRSGTQVYSAYFHPTNSWGQMLAQSVLEDTAADTLSINPIANWDAHCTLTGGACQAMGKNGDGSDISVTATAPDSRKILSWNGTAGVAFRWDSLTTTQQGALTTGDAAPVTANRLNYLRGDRSKEVAAGGPFRTRTGVLGDVVGSSPTWVGPPQSPYVVDWKDKLYASQTPKETSYATFATANATRQNVVYVGANDGLMHGFRAGAFDASGNFATTAGAPPNDGVEALAYMPGSVLSMIHSNTKPALDFSSTAYSHNFFVDAAPATGDLYYNGAWRTWLVSGVGPGGNPNGPVNDDTSTSPGTLFVLDVTKPADFSEANAASLVVDEQTSASLSCANDTACGAYLGATYGTPLIRRLHNGKWAAIFGNGLNSANGKAGVFIMVVEPDSAGKSYYFLNTNSGPATPSGAKNGIVSVTSADLDGDHITDYLYAGDLYGNVWRFDLTSSDPAVWAATAPTKLFQTPTGQPITGRVTVSAAADTLPARILVGFGTGRQRPQTLTSAATFASGTQALYGLWDWNMTAWNAKSPNASYASLPATTPAIAITELTTQSVAQTITGSGSVSGYRTVSSNKVCWKGSTACASDNTKRGWTLSLPTSTEQVIYSPVVIDGAFLVNTTIPAVNQALTCDTIPAAGYTMSLSLGNGGAPPQSFFADANGNFVTYGGAAVAGIGLSGTGTPTVMTTSKGTPFLVTQTTSGKPAATKISRMPPKGSRLNWIKLR